MSKGNDKSSSEEEEYMVEKILDKRIKGNKVQYYLKWKNYPEADNTWEPVDNLADCKDLIRDFEEKLKKKAEEQQSKAPQRSGSEKETEKEKDKGESMKKKRTTDPASKEDASSVKKRKLDDKTGFDKGWEPDRIIGATDSSGELMFLIKWKEHDGADLVPSKTANVKCPQVVIRFYEERLSWNPV